MTGWLPRRSAVYGVAGYKFYDTVNPQFLTDLTTYPAFQFKALLLLISLIFNHQNCQFLSLSTGSVPPVILLKLSKYDQTPLYLGFIVMVFFLMAVTVLSPVSEIYDQPDTGNDRKVVILPLVLDQLQVRCQVGPPLETHCPYCVSLRPMSMPWSVRYVRAPHQSPVSLSRLQMSFSVDPRYFTPQVFLISAILASSILL